MAIEVPAVAGKIINLGRAGENLATTVVFDVSSWIEEFGANGVFSLFVQQGTDDYYPQAVTGPLNGKVRWDVTNSNTTIVGLGKCELSYNELSDIEKSLKEGYYNNGDFYEDSAHTIKITPNSFYLYEDLGDNNKLYYYDGINYVLTSEGSNDTKQVIVVKSMIYDIMVTNALDAGQSGEMPDPIQRWIDSANAVLAEVQDTADWVVGPGGTPVEPSSTNNAQYYMNEASRYASNASSSATTATNAKNDAVSAKSDAISAKNDAVSAKTAAETAENNIKSLSGTQTVTKTNAGADPSVTLNTSTTPYKFEFTLPKGCQWFTGNKGGNPPGSVTDAKINDYYLDTSNGAIWKCTSNSGNAWSSSGNIKGPQGDTGATGATGADGITPTLSSSKSGKITTIKYTDKNHTSGNDVLATISDGQDGTGAGTVTSVAVSNATNGGLTISGSPITSSGTIKVGHSNVLANAQTTQDVYPIKIDKNGHISEYGSAVTIPSAADATPLMDGNAAVGTSADYAREDHVHPTDTSRAASNHSHGNITSGGDITAAAPTIASGDQIIINDNSTSKITNGPTFDGSTTTKYLSQKGTWESIPDISSKIDTAGTGLSKSGTTLNHSNSVTAQTTSAVYPIKIDAQGHITEYGSAVSVPTATSTSPKMDGTATVGSETTWAKGDHIHPTDTSRQAKITASGILKGNGSGTVSAATAGTDYIAPPSSPANGNVLTYNGSSWVASAPATGLPSMTGNSGKYLYTDGQAADWVEIDALPSQSSSTNGWVLTSVYNSSTSVSSAEWQVLSGVTGQLSTAAVRNIYAGTADLTSSDTLPEGTIYLLYEA